MDTYTEIQNEKIMHMGLVCLLYSGFTILMREAIYNDNPLDNWMGPVNSCITLAGGGAAAGFLFGAITAGAFGPGGWDNLGYWFKCALIGVLIGAIVHFALPGIRTAFKENRVLYYTAPAIFGGLGILLFAVSILRNIKDK